MKALLLLLLSSCAAVPSAARRLDVATSHLESCLGTLPPGAAIQREECFEESDAECIRLGLGHDCARQGAQIDGAQKK